MKLVAEDQDWASMPALPPNFKMSSFDEATALTALPSAENNTYKVDLKRDWAIGLGIPPLIFHVYRNTLTQCSSPRRIPSFNSLPCSQAILHNAPRII